MGGFDCGATAAHRAHMDDVYAVCFAIGRAEVLLDRDWSIPDADRLVRLAEVIADLRQALNIPGTPLARADSMEGDR